MGDVVDGVFVLAAAGFHNREQCFHELAARFTLRAEADFASDNRAAEGLLAVVVGGGDFLVLPRTSWHCPLLLAFCSGIDHLGG